MTPDTPKSWYLRLIATAALLVVYPSLTVAHAQIKGEADALANLSLEELMRVEVVSASRRTQTLADVPDAVHVITRDDILRSGVRSLPEALRMAPGVDVAQMSPSGWAVGVRGEAGRFSNKLQVLIDGRSVFSPLYSGVLWEAERVPLEDIERIEVIRGPAGAIWGTNAVNGVINIITRDAQHTQGSLAVASVGSDGSDRLLLRHGTALGQDAWLKLYGQADRQADSVDSSGVRDNNRAHAETIGLRFDQAQKNGARLSVQGQVLHSTKNGKLPLPDFTTLAMVVPTVQSTDKATLTTSLDTPLSAASELHVQATLQSQRNEQRGYAIHRSESADVDVQHRWHPQDSRHDVLWGMGVTWYQDKIDSVPLITVDPAAQTLVHGRVFAQDEYALVPDQLLLTYGARVDHDPYSGAQASPNARLLWKMNQRSSSWIAASRAVRAPARGEADGGINFNIEPSDGGTPFTARLGFNPGARIVEKVSALEAGWRSQVRQNLSVDVAAFVQRYDPLLGVSPNIYNDLLTNPNIVSDTTVNGRRVVTAALTSGTRATTRGIELAADWRIAKYWRQQLAYSYMETRFSTPAIITTLGGTPRSLISLRESFDLSSRWMLDVWLRYTSARKDPMVPFLDAPSRTALDINLRWAMSPEVTLSMGGHNLGRQYTQEINPRISSSVERAAYAKVEAAF
ncbi:TonB-dependent receptor [Aquabacterium sp.]|uniref:TonB-dependent receptor plug domain-containing protein n=1 Tax=Aquabacterium sp. TaxID=1872578 RepID=UPI0019939E00|nr:TonB-dependent receptor [Aquabacterium sp.]MBC7699354.1 TonB-dependent receptor [Aquabacterium sp.]